ncbi:dihydrofolate reductase [Afipia carboxidovorans]|nr:dihydrofolate reductase [Afipia carboxidovorans]
MSASAPFAPAVVFIVAIADNGVIGRDNTMPWHLRSDLRRFKQLTLNKPVVMGRKTFLSIGRPLPKRTNIVVTRDPAFRAAGVVVATTLDAAYEIALGDALRRGASEVMVIGGAEIFYQWMPRATRLEITHVHAEPEGDTFLRFEMAEWQDVARSRPARGPDDSADFSYATYARAGRH